MYIYFQSKINFFVVSLLQPYHLFGAWMSRRLNVRAPRSIYDYRSTDSGCYIKAGTERKESDKTDARVAFFGDIQL